jgi:hypothetical protein
MTIGCLLKCPGHTEQPRGRHVFTFGLSWLLPHTKFFQAYPLNSLLTLDFLLNVVEPGAMLPTINRATNTLVDKFNTHSNEEFADIHKPLYIPGLLLAIT